jgi:peptidoglycan/xylan/chitin deacetylase (PgdA/CDA1 family)
VFSLALAAGAVALATSGPTPRAPERRVLSFPALPEPHFALRRNSRVARELRAIRRLAAHGLPIYCGGRRGRLIALTFDDGPGVYTRLAIRKLRNARLHATFFLVGKSMRAFPKLAPLERRVAAFGDHTMTHPFLPALTPGAVVHEILAARSLIEREVREPIVLFRPPYEGRTRAIDAIVRRLKMAEVLWNVDSADSLGANYAGIEHNVIEGLRPGSIVLMHENRGQTIRALPAIFAAIRRRHLHAVTVPQLLTADPPTVRQLRAGVRGCFATKRLSNGS